VYITIDNNWKVISLCLRDCGVKSVYHLFTLNLDRRKKGHAGHIAIHVVAEQSINIPKRMLLERLKISMKRL